jgi:hypothetical protein
LSSGLRYPAEPMNTRIRLLALGFAAITTLAIAGCCKKGADSGGDGGAFTEKTDQVDDVKVGDEIVVESGKASFWKGKITKVEGTKVTYEYGSSKSTDSAEKGDVYVLTQGEHKGTEKPGDYVICRTSTSFYGACVVKAVNGAVYVCEDSGGSSHNLSAPEVILPKPATQANIKERIETETKHRNFLAAAKAAGKPAMPAGWKPRPGADVVALFAGSSWYGAKVTKVTGNKVTVQWDDKSSPSDRDPGEVAPKPTAAQKVNPGQYVILRPTGSSHRWEFAKVDKVEGTSVVVLDQDDKSKTVSNKDLSPIAP